MDTNRQPSRPSRYAAAETSHLLRTLERAISDADRAAHLCARGAGQPDPMGAARFRAWSEAILALRGEIAFSLERRP